MGHKALATTTVEEATECLIDYRGKTPTKTESGVRLITAKVIKKGRILDEPREFIADDYYNQWMRRGLPKAGDVLLTTEAPLGEVAILRGDEKIALAQRVILLRARSGIVDPEYLFYALQSKYSQAELMARATGTTVLGIKQSELRQCRLPLLPLPDQRLVASILSSYDKLIENSRRRITTLDAMALGLYREWFVSYRYPGHESHSIISSPVGPIPNGWQVKRLGEVLTLNYGKALTKEDRRDGPYPVYGSSGIVGFHDASLTRGPGVVVGRKGNVGTVFWADTDFFVIDTAYYVTSSLPLRFIYFDLQTKNFINSDAAVPGLSRQQAYALYTVVPPHTLLERFCGVAETLDNYAMVLRRQIDTLSRIRDLLLHRLLSGKLKLSEAAE